MSTGRTMEVEQYILWTQENNEVYVYCDFEQKSFFPPEIESRTNAEKILDLKCVFKLLEMTLKQSRWSI